jgi:hypothetical protein
MSGETIAKGEWRVVRWRLLFVNPLDKRGAKLEVETRGRRDEVSIYRRCRHWDIGIFAKKKIFPWSDSIVVNYAICGIPRGPPLSPSLSARIHKATPTELHDSARL